MTSLLPTEFLNKALAGLDMDDASKNLLINSFHIKYLQELTGIFALFGVLQQAEIQKMYSIVEQSLQAFPQEKKDELKLDTVVNELESSILKETMETFMVSLDEAEQQVIKTNLEAITSEPKQD